MKFKELKDKTAAELEELLLEAREKIRELRFKVSARELKNIREIRQIKKETAQLLTARRQLKS